MVVGGCSRALAHTPLCLRPEHGGVARFTDTLLLQCEFVLLENLQFDLVVFHPYRPLQLYLRDIGLEAECMQTAWFVGWLGLVRAVELCADVARRWCGQDAGE